MSHVRGYFRIRPGLSWHVVYRDEAIQGPRRWPAFCGRIVSLDNGVNELPFDEKSCETCLRLSADVAPLTAAELGEDDASTHNETAP